MSPKFYPPPVLDHKPLPFAEAVRHDSTLYLSGQLGNLPGKMELAPGGIAGETRQMMENIRAALRRCDGDLEHIVKCTVFLADMADWSAFNEVYCQYFSAHLPARSALGASGLALGARVEMECIAVLPRSGN